MSANLFLVEFFKQFIVFNAAAIVIGSIAECFNAKSIFKPATRKQNKQYWEKRVREAIKGYLYSIPAFVVEAASNAKWDMDYEKIYCSHPEFHFGRFVILMIIYSIMYDSLLYWYHRLLHIRTPIDLYKHIHSFHHQFNPVTSYANHAFHPIDALLLLVPHYAIGITMSWIFPFDVLSHRIPGLFFLIYGFIVHDGTFWPDHKTHHETVNFNFASGYSRFWDVLCNTYKSPSEKRASVHRIVKRKVHML